MSTYYISPEKTKLFHSKEGQILVSLIKSRMGLFFSVSNNVVPVEDILEMHFVDYVLDDSERGNARVLCYYIA